MSISSFEKFRKARERAKARTEELIEGMRKQRWCEDIPFDEVVTPKMRQDLENQFFQIEKLKDKSEI